MYRSWMKYDSLYLKKTLYSFPECSVKGNENAEAAIGGVL